MIPLVGHAANVLTERKNAIRTGNSCILKFSLEGKAPDRIKPPTKIGQDMEEEEYMKHMIDSFVRGNGWTEPPRAVQARADPPKPLPGKSGKGSYNDEEYDGGDGTEYDEDYDEEEKQDMDRLVREAQEDFNGKPNRPPVLKFEVVIMRDEKTDQFYSYTYVTGWENINVHWLNQMDPES